MSYGYLNQLRRPDSWGEEPISQYTRNWFVLTGVSEAFTKSCKAEKMVKQAGLRETTAGTKTRQSLTSTLVLQSLGYPTAQRDNNLYTQSSMKSYAAEAKSGPGSAEMVGRDHLK